MTIDHYENFPVASILCPAALRPTVAAIYWYARTADDIADEGQRTTSERLAALATYRDDLDATLEGRPTSGQWTKVFDALARAIARECLPPRPLHDLLDAFAQDAANPMYETREELLDYCRRSANPIGRLLLHLYRVDDAESLSQSDAICTALQLINFWQDLSVDLPRGRVYVPQADLRSQGLQASDLQAAGHARHVRAIVRALCEWARAMMLAGAPLALRVPGRAGWELRLVVQGGLRMLDRIRAMDHDTVHRRPRLGKADAATMAWRALTM